MVRGGIGLDNTQIFISHRSTDKVFADILESFLVKCGFNSNQIFCSSLPGNDIQQGISAEIKKAITESKIDIVILSDAYYLSPYCQNELGIIWFKEGTVKIPICMPEINEDAMQGFFDKEYKIRRLEKKEDIETICDRLKPFCSNFLPSTAKLNSYISQLMSEYQRLLGERKIIISPSQEPNGSNEMEQRILAGDFSDDELLLLKFFHDTQTNFLANDYQDFNAWMIKVDFDKDINSPPDNILVEEGLMGPVPGDDFFDIGSKLSPPYYRELLKISTRCIDYINSQLSKYQAKETVAGNPIDKLIADGFSDEECLFVKYIADTERQVLMAGWQTEYEETAIQAWEELEGLDDTLRRNYSKLLMKFSVRKFIDISAKTSHNNPKEYRIRDNIFEFILNVTDDSKNRMAGVVKQYKQPDSDLPF